MNCNQMTELDLLSWQQKGFIFYFVIDVNSDEGRSPWASGLLAVFDRFLPEIQVGGRHKVKQL